MGSGLAWRVHDLLTLPGTHEGVRQLHSFLDRGRTGSEGVSDLPQVAQPVVLMVISPVCGRRDLSTGYTQNEKTLLMSSACPESQM